MADESWNTPREEQDVSAENRREERTGREDPGDPEDVGSAKETDTVRGHGSSQHVRQGG